MKKHNGGWIKMYEFYLLSLCPLDWIQQAKVLMPVLMHVQNG